MQETQANGIQLVARSNEWKDELERGNFLWDRSNDKENGMRRTRWTCASTQHGRQCAIMQTYCKRTHEKIGCIGSLRACDMQVVETGPEVVNQPQTGIR